MKNERVFATRSGTLHLPYTSKADEGWTAELESAFPGRVCDFKVWADLSHPIAKQMAKYYGVTTAHLDVVLKS
mgnify:CR=1 FL=1